MVLKLIGTAKETRELGGLLNSLRRELGLSIGMITYLALLNYMKTEGL